MNPHTALVNAIRLGHSKGATRLWQNPVGQAWAGKWRRTTAGILVKDPAYKMKFGLRNGSSDLIGWTAREITEEDVGKTLAVFTAVEVKTGRGRESAAQAHWRHEVTEAGGLAGVARSVEDAAAILERPAGQEPPPAPRDDD